MKWLEVDAESTIPERFARQVELHPEHPAIAGDGATVTYAELDALSNRYAAALLARAGSSRPRRVALMLKHRSVVAGALAGLKSGAAIVTLNPGDPPARVAAIRAAVEPDLVLTSAEHAGLARAAGFAGAQVVDVDAGARDSGAIPRPPIAPDDLAVLISTSGSTGRPKVVMQSHRNVLHNVLRYTNGLDIRPDDRLALLAALSGGQGLVTTWAALLNGCTLCPYPIAERGVGRLAEWMAEAGVTVFDTIPSVLRNFTRALRDRRVPGVRLVRLASEGAFRSDFDAFQRHFARSCVLASVLASSEAGIIAQSILRSGDSPPPGPLPVGRPVAGIEVLLLDSGRPVADGQVGEVVVQGRYLSPGYWGDEALTAERFAVVEGRRRFRTGDLARRSADGTLTMAGRADAQVKVRGHRLQLEEVERAIAALPGVAAVTVALRTSERGDARLTAYIVLADGAAPAVGAMRRALRTLLPPHAVPTAFRFLDAMPLTSHGKVDRDALAAVVTTDAAGSPGRSAVSETEELLMGVWSDVLERDVVSADDTFLDLGGDSLAAASIAAVIDDAFGVEFDLRVFADDPTVSQLAALVAERRGVQQDDEALPIERSERPGPLSYAQERYLRQEARSESESRWNLVAPFSIRGPLDVDALRKSVEVLVARHEILRTSFVTRQGQVRAEVRPSVSVEVRVDDLRGEADQQALIDRIVESERTRPFDLERGPLLRLRVLRLGELEHRLLRTSHHLIHDAASWKILFDELAVAYEDAVQGRPASLGPGQELQYIDYAAWERASARRDTRRAERDITWWADELAGAPAPIDLPFARADQAGPVPAEDIVRWGIPREHGEALNALGRVAGATYFMTRLALFASCLANQSGAEELVIATPLSTRTRPELQRMVGPFINVSMLRLRLGPAPRFGDVLAEVRRTVLNAGEHATLPWEVLAARLRRRGVRAPRASARFVAWSSVTAMRFGGLELEPLPRPCGESWGFRLGVNPYYEQDRCWADFDPLLYDPAGVRTFIGRVQELAAEIHAAPHSVLARK